MISPSEKTVLTLSLPSRLSPVPMDSLGVTLKFINPTHLKIPRNNRPGGALNRLRPVLSPLNTSRQPAPPISARRKEHRTADPQQILRDSTLCGDSRAPHKVLYQTVSVFRSRCTIPQAYTYRTVLSRRHLQLFALRKEITRVICLI
jgi:hypothetical protein